MSPLENIENERAYSHRHASTGNARTLPALNVSPTGKQHAQVPNFKRQASVMSHSGPACSSRRVSQTHSQWNSRELHQQESMHAQQSHRSQHGRIALRTILPSAIGVDPFDMFNSRLADAQSSAAALGHPRSLEITDAAER